MTWVYVIVGIICLIALQSLRGALSMVFPVRNVRASTRPEARQFGGLELIDETTSALNYLGFEGPAWVCDEERQTDIENVNNHAVFRNVGKNTVAWVGPTLDIAQPDQPLFYYTTALDDGRFAVTQVSDPYFSAVDDPNTPAQTIAASDKATELKQHLDFVQTLNSSPIANVPIREAVMRFAGEHMNGIRQRLIERGMLRESEGIARPGFRFACRILGKFATRPVRQVTDPAGIPTARLAFLARVAARASERAPAQSTQWLLLLLSAALFLAIGWPLFGLNYTLIILAVILFHEGGHWAAMKAFGYRNPHITLLPLLGGVTIGHETDPGAVKRVWVSLAGPLPGIILGWLLVYFISMEIDASLYSEWLLPTILVLLFVNYLNVLPIPPLDGAHVVKALLPPGWVYVQIVAVFVGVVIGVYVAYLLDFWPLAFIAALQLFAVKNLWSDAKLVSYFDRERPPVTDDEEIRTEWLLEKLETLLGAPRKAAKRIQLAQSVLSQIDMRPMGGVHRSIASLVYLSLVAVPVGVLAFSALDPFSYEMSPEATAIYDELNAEKERFSVEASAMSIEELVQELAEGDRLAVPATADEIQLLESRMGHSLPDHLREFYLHTNGLDALGLSPVAEIRRVDPKLFTDEELQYHVYEGKLSFYDQSFEEIVVPLEATRNWWQIGYDAEWGYYFFVNPNTAIDENALFEISAEDGSAYVDLLAKLRNAWVNEKSDEIYAANSEQMYAAAVARMQNLSIDELVAMFPKPGLLERFVLSGSSLPGPATKKTISETERRIGRTLPTEHVDLLSIHNGFGPIFMLPAEEIQPARNVLDVSRQSTLDLSNADADDENVLTMEELNQCWVIAGLSTEGYEDSDAAELYGHIYWCPDLDPDHQYLSQMYGGYHPTLTAVVRHVAAQSGLGY